MFMTVEKYSTRTQICVACSKSSFLFCDQLINYAFFHPPCPVTSSYVRDGYLQRIMDEYSSG